MSEQNNHNHEYWMRYARQLAARAEALGEVPVGAVVVKGDEVIGEGWNQSITQHDPAGHAEVMAIRQAALHVQNYRTIDTRLYVTLEPCPMCAGLLVHARIATLIFGAYDLKTGSAGSVMNLVQNPLLNHQIDVIGGVEEQLCADQISAFFKRRRAEKKRAKEMRNSDA
ncbi:tRNA adenosine(34) deaminase TadA [Alteromonas sp. ASW11-36]|uniref:tRNA-specific adenosine deaminase n=1 Tax=Alteromonas arenosi TaxID=3055817 RepID=A0ABT7SVK0_9ALTE|nr:tRNA adenosine(34) deaminase TadA [Alteromonas sp. ASW11-36]MDM7860195.1 tRNA adenosine(34) deaminase TadA [Alteromonas sp. ASW11-36]